MYSTEWLIEANVVRAAFLTAYMYNHCPNLRDHIQHSQNISNICRASIINICSNCTNKNKCPVYIDTISNTITWHNLLPTIDKNKIPWYQGSYIGKCKIGPGLAVLTSFKVLEDQVLRLPYDIFTEVKSPDMVFQINSLVECALKGTELQTQALCPETSIRTEVALSKTVSTSVYRMLYSYETVTCFKTKAITLVPERRLGSEKIEETLSRIFRQNSASGGRSLLYWTFIAVREDHSYVIDKLLTIKEVRIGRATSRGFGKFVVEDYKVHNDVDEFLRQRLGSYCRYIDTLCEKCVSKLAIVPLVPESKVITIPKIASMSYTEALVLSLNNFFEKNGVGKIVLKPYVNSTSGEILRMWSSTSNVPKLSPPYLGRTARLYLKISSMSRELAQVLARLYVVGLESCNEVHIPSGFNVLKVPILDIGGLS